MKIFKILKFIGKFIIELIALAVIVLANNPIVQMYISQLISTILG